ncbi:VTT domain-containing protein [Saxibacter everestensis]|uniref:VTT domain-containing protein n=1 Tax=Saxibacter everestensis TaxID=2909229 RepID=A0ABY8QTD0_9MICO|nr:VTT domain-containing protein [Brevibacteriaceae bacterium ZFBP1038]
MTLLAAALSDPTVVALPDWAPSWLGFLSAETLLGWFPSSVLVVVICIVVFIETGLLFPLLPGDSLLFVGGLLVAEGTIAQPLWLVCLCVLLAAFAGDQTAYLIGRKLGPKIFHKRGARFLKPEYLEKTNDYFAKYGGRTIIIARFVPIVRTFAAVVAGASSMHYRTFVAFNAIGAAAWGIGVTVLGFFLGQISFVKENIELILVLIVLISVIPIVVEYLKARRESKVASTQQG